jgi:hypothetical protein
MLLSLTLNIRSLLMFIAAFILSNALHNTHPLNAHEDELSVLPIEKNTNNVIIPILKNIYLRFMKL